MNNYFYPLKFNPIYKDFIWGGHELEKLGKKQEKGLIAESWEISGLPGNESIVSTGPLSGFTLPLLVEKYGKDLVGSDVALGNGGVFPLLVKLIDACRDLSVQVHPDDGYAGKYENNRSGKTEAWFIISAAKGSKLVTGLKKGIKKNDFIDILNKDRVGEILTYIGVAAGDVIYVPPGLIHAIGKGIVLAEIQQSSDLTYRIYDYGRLDKDGNKRPLHIEKALDVIDFNLDNAGIKAQGLEIKLGPASKKTIKTANRYFSMEVYSIKGKVNEETNGSRFYIYIVISGEADIYYNGGNIKAASGDTLLFPAALGKFSLEGDFTALKCYVPDLSADIINPLVEAGYKKKEIFSSIPGLR